MRTVTRISTRGVEETEELRTLARSMVERLQESGVPVTLAQVMFQASPAGDTVGAVLALADDHSVVRHATASDWQRAVEDVERGVLEELRLRAEADAGG